jgi:hypothetical protein
MRKPSITREVAMAIVDMVEEMVAVGATHEQIVGVLTMMLSVSCETEGGDPYAAHGQRVRHSA